MDNHRQEGIDEIGDLARDRRRRIDTRAPVVSAVGVSRRRRGCDVICICNCNFCSYFATAKTLSGS